MSKIVCFGEVLWDVFPTQKKIGGAPLNVALRLNSFGNEVVVISCVGNDVDGEKLIDYIKSNGIPVEEIQKSFDCQTSYVKVLLDNKGSASYTIEYPCAWDYIILKKSSIDMVKNSDAFIFGSLVTRNEVSRETLMELIEFAKFKVFDVNLRAPHYHMNLLKELMERSDFIKFNDEELEEICGYFDFKSDLLEDLILFIGQKTNTKQICVTLGAKGAIYFTQNKFYRSSGYQVDVKDTVGAGDSFLGTLINQVLKNNQPQDAVEYACAVGALVASKEGANPKIFESDIATLLN